MELISIFVGMGIMLFLFIVYEVYKRKNKKTLYSIEKLVLEASLDISEGYKKLKKLYEAIKEIEKNGRN